MLFGYMKIMVCYAFTLHNRIIEHKVKKTKPLPIKERVCPNRGVANASG